MNCCSHEPSAQVNSDSIGRDISRFFDGKVRWFRGRRLASTSRHIAEHLSQRGLGGRSVLELGCGAGGLCLELVRLGASRANGIDLSRKMISTAQQAALSRGLSGRVLFGIGDGAEMPLPLAQIVILDRVICCYPAMERLLKNTLDACTGIYSISVPRDSGIWRYLIKAAISLERVYLELMRCRAYTYVHSTVAMKKIIGGRGFHEASRDSIGPWLVWTFERDGAGTSVGSSN